MRGKEGKGVHVAIIMDGNGRWATHRGLPRVAGHRAGVATVRRIVECALDLEIGCLTLYAFSSDTGVDPQLRCGAFLAAPGLSASRKGATPGARRTAAGNWAAGSIDEVGAERDRQSGKGNRRGDASSPARCCRLLVPLCDRTRCYRCSRPFARTNVAAGFT